MIETLVKKYEQLKTQHGTSSKKAEALAPRLANLVLLEAIDERASDIHLEPKPQGLVIRFRIDGMLHEALVIPATEKINLVPCFKVMAQIESTSGGSLQPKDGRINVKMGETMVDVRVNMFPTLFGEKLAMRVLVKERDLLPLDKLGFYPPMLKLYRQN